MRAKVIKQKMLIENRLTVHHAAAKVGVHLNAGNKVALCPRVTVCFVENHYAVGSLWATHQLSADITDG
jgi:hypothetical protein